MRKVKVGATRTIVAGSLLVLMIAATLANVHANGRVVSYERRIAGPYEIAVGKIPDTPVVGSLHLTMTVTDVATDTFVVDGDVFVTATGPESSEVEIGPLEAQSDPNNPVFYDVVTQVDRTGVWTFTVDVSGDQGEASADFRIEVEESNPVTGIVTLIALLAFVAVVGFSVRVFLRERGRSRRRNR